MNFSRLRWPQVLALGTGGFLLLWGLAGFLVTGFADFAGHADTAVLGLRVNPLANLVHAVTGVAFMIVAPGVKRLGTAAVLLAGLYLVMFGIGAADDPATNVFNVNVPSNVLHLLTGFAGMTAVQGAVWMKQCDKLSASAS
ncbi:hypothetical protein Lesp02_67970 [Lentzea sp. NBRC 105346]|uniref:DUF4383 domain-containing protein n=1 Tax=Lentzea sp. NBRC 105346 TaxID=3032205 RepID=UPI0024A404CE|nr:DUF4383 domain-containing protein [Lentzea sp. NBRC 105346]GLZ34610.1 hypothetical protein Lesp02_67970 [Lentzea sp. NBRC 105346]